MRSLILAAGLLAGAFVSPAAAAPTEDPRTTTDVRCIVVAGSLIASDDAQAQDLGRANLFYFMGRLEGRGDQPDFVKRIVEEEKAMSGPDVQAQAKICGGIFTNAMQTVQSLNDAIQQQAGGTAPTTPK